jgi:ABC-type multidrug transport system permease subunit
MRSILLLGHQDLRVFLKVKASLVWLFVMPLAFVGFMGYAVRGPGSPGNAQPTVRVENADTNFLSGMLLETLGSQGLRVLDAASTESASHSIRIPADFTERVLSGRQAVFHFEQKEDAVTGLGAMLEFRLARATVAMNSHLLQASRVGTNNLSAVSIRAAQDAAPTVVLDAHFAGRKPQPTGFGFSLPGNMVMYVMMNLLIFGGASLSGERRRGVTRRLATYPMSRAELVAGKIYGLILLAIVQVVVFLVAGRYLFGVRFGANLPVIFLTLFVYAWVAASLGILIGSVIQAEDKVIGICVLASLLMASLGGCWWPLEVAPPIMKTIALCLPTGWALEALHQLISFGGTLADVALPIGVLALFGIAANTLAACFFKY